MKALRAWMMRVIGMFGSARAERELAAEIESNLQLHVDDNIRAGMTPQEARRRALLAFGGVEKTKEEYRDRRGLPALESILQDVRYAVRGMRRAPSFALACIATLALGIGVNSAIFSVVYGVLFAPLPYAQPERLITIWTSHPEIRRQANAMSRDNALDLARTMSTIDGIGIVQANVVPATVPVDGQGVTVNAAQVTPETFDVLGVRALHGRTLQRGDVAGAFVISYRFWQRQFGADPSIVGRTFGSGRSSGTVVGVMPKGFELPYPSMLQATVSFVGGTDVDLWAPLDAPKPGSTDRGERLFAVVARLKDGASLEQARLDLANAWRALADAYPAENGGWSAFVVPLHEQAVAPVRAAMLLLLGSVGVVLLIACVNVANLMLARGVARQRELAMRVALGAKQSRLLQQVIVEGLLLASLGALLGLLFARWTTPLLVRLAPAGTPRLTEGTADLTVTMFTLGVAVACGMAVSILPGLGASRTPVRTALVEGGRAASGGRRRVRSALVASEVGLAVVLTIGAGLLGRSFVAVLDVDPGFRSDHLLTMVIAAQPHHDTPEKRIAFYQQLFARLEAVPGVISVGGNTRLPFTGANSSTQVAVEGRQPVDGQWPEADFRRAMHRYFETMNIPIVAGRGFTAADRAGAPPVVVINGTLAKRLFGDQDPIGKQLQLGPSSPVRRATIVGVVGDLRHQRPDVPPAPEVYINYLQGPPVSPLLVVRTSADPAAMTPAIVAAMKEVETALVPSNIRTMDDLRVGTIGDRVFLMSLIALFGVLALVLAAVGVYGVLTLVVAERRREMGIRLALGASPGGLVALVVRHAVLLTLTGVAGGVGVALALTPLISNQLFAVHAADPRTIVAVAGTLLVVALTAAVVPAVRVMRVDPVSTLRLD